MITRGSVRLLLTSLLFSAAYTNAVLADDTDIYLGDQTPLKRIRPTLMLSTSSKICCIDSRMFSRRVFPVPDIDAPLSTVPSETNSIRGISVPILESADDATQMITGTSAGQMALNSTTLDANQSPTIETTQTYSITTSANDAKERPNGAFKNDLAGQLKIEDLKSNSGQKRIGLRFENVNIPADATIINATVQFTGKFSDSKPMSILVRGEDPTSPTAAAAFTGAKGDLQGRFNNATTQTVRWLPGGWLPEQTFNTPNLEPIFAV